MEGAPRDRPPAQFGPMFRSLLAVLAFAALAVPAHAALELLPGSSPQRAEIGFEFKPIRVRATDTSGAPVAGARVAFSLPYLPNILRPAEFGCFPDLGWHCAASTDGTGIAQLPTLYGYWEGTQSFEVGAAAADGTSLGRVTVVLTVDPVSAPASIEVLSGAGQRVVAGSGMEPIVVRVRDAAGRPLAGVEVDFSYRDGTHFSFAGVSPWSSTAFTDAQGIAVTPGLTASKGIGPGTMYARAYPPGNHVGQFAVVDYTITTPDGRTSLELRDMWWMGPAELGWGVSVAQHGDRLFAVHFAYDERGEPTWRALPDGSWGDRFYTFGGMAYSPRGSPWYAYDASQLVAGSPAAYMHFTFGDEQAARFMVDDAVGRTVKSLVRQDYTSATPAPLTGIGDMWWGGPGQNGWGIALMEQPGGLFSVWFTYDADGRPTWFAMPSGSWTSATTFEGEIYRTSGPTWPAFDVARLRIERAGTFTYRFRDAERATFSWTIGARSGSMPIERQPF